MSGVLVIPNQFATAVTATGAQLDSDFNTVTAYINDPTNRNNYIADGGAATNTLTLTFSPPVVGGYTAGLEITFKATNTNTGAVVVNANALGNKSLVNPNGSALQSGQLLAGSIAKAVYDGTNFIFISASAQKPAEAKAWANFQGTITGTITPLASYNITSIIRNGTGTYAITFTTPFSSANYVVSANANSNNAFIVVTPRTANSAVVQIFISSAAADSGNVDFVAYGTQ